MRISLGGMIRRGFLSVEERKELVWLARDGSAEHRVGRRANAILLLDDGLSCERVAKVLYLDDDTVRGWRKIYDERGIAGLEQFDAGGSSSRLSTMQEEALKAYVAQALPQHNAASWSLYRAGIWHCLRKPRRIDRLIAPAWT